jgi:hypothetical protein
MPPIGGLTANEAYEPSDLYSAWSKLDLSRPLVQCLLLAKAMRWPLSTRVSLRLGPTIDRVRTSASVGCF